MTATPHEDQHRVTPGRGMLPQAGQSARTPPRRGWSLGIRLGLLAALIVTGVMGSISGLQILGEQRAAAAELRSLLADSLTPLARELGAAASREEAAELVEAFHQAYLEDGHDDHQLTLRTADGERIVDTWRGQSDLPVKVVEAEVEVRSPALSAAPLTLGVRQDGTALAAAQARRWRGWALHLASTALVTLVLLAVVIRQQVTGPMDRLLRGIKKMELGYWDDLPDPGGAWEIRVVAWRFRVLGQELGRTVDHLLAAQRRAAGVERGASVDPDWLAERREASVAPSWPVEVEGEIERLREALAELVAADPLLPGTRALARTAWERLAPHAERLGQLRVRSELEDAALTVLDPEGYARVRARVEMARPQLDELASTCGARLREALSARGVPVVSLDYRVKHAAGVWRKMQQKDLDLRDVHDLVALRIIVPTASDCYLVLGSVHELFDPIVARFKDYIAAPKPNGYRSLHTTLRNGGGQVFELQIRSIAMHRAAEQGEAGHSLYREATRVPLPRAPAGPADRLRRWLGLG